MVAFIIIYNSVYMVMGVSIFHTLYATSISMYNNLTASGGVSQEDSGNKNDMEIFCVTCADKLSNCRTML